jgi:hypothetical protein
MALVFRNVDVDPDDPVETWPAEAVATALERGELPHWRRIARAVRNDPWGEVARTVEAVVEMDQPYGSGPLFLDIVASARADATSKARADVAALVTQMIATSGMTLRECAQKLGTSASRLSTYARGSVTPGADMLWRIARVTGHALVANRR